jgi:rhomboid protease GluP
VAWKTLGAGDSAAMLAGQWWRAATALCLHADPAHLFGNAACGALFLSLLCRETGVGLGFALTLAAGVGGNVLKAVVQGPGMHFLGASTAVFGALGALGGVRLASGWPPLSARRSAPAGAALMLLAMLGAGSEEGGAVDLAGHLFGFSCGAFLGLAVGFFLTRRGRPGPSAQIVFGLATMLAAAGAWALALAQAPAVGP